MPQEKQSGAVPSYSYYFSYIRSVLGPPFAFFSISFVVIFLTIQLFSLLIFHNSEIELFFYLFLCTSFSEGSKRTHLRFYRFGLCSRSVDNVSIFIFCYYLFLLPLKLEDTSFLLYVLLYFAIFTTMLQSC